MLRPSIFLEVCRQSEEKYSQSVRQVMVSKLLATAVKLVEKLDNSQSLSLLIHVLLIDVHEVTYPRFINTFCGSDRYLLSTTTRCNMISFI